MTLLEECLLYYNNNLTNKITENELDDDEQLRFTLLDMQLFAELYYKEQCDIHVVSFELPSDDIFDKPEVTLNNPLEEFYYYERPAYLKEDQRQFRERLQKALDYLKGN